MSNSGIMYAVLLILPLISTTLAGKEEFNLDAGKKELLEILDLFNGVIQLEKDYVTLKKNIEEPKEFDLLICNGRDILTGEDVRKLQSLGDSDAKKLLQKIDSYKTNFQKLLDDAKVEDGRIPLDRRLTSVTKKYEQNLAVGFTDY